MFNKFDLFKNNNWVVSQACTCNAPIANVAGWFQIPAEPSLSLLLTTGQPESGTWATIPKCLYIHPQRSSRSVPGLRLVRFFVHA